VVTAENQEGTGILLCKYTCVSQLECINRRRLGHIQHITALLCIWFSYDPTVFNCANIPYFIACMYIVQTTLFPSLSCSMYHLLKHIEDIFFGASMGVVKECQKSLIYLCLVLVYRVNLLCFVSF